MANSKTADLEKELIRLDEALSKNVADLDKLFRLTEVNIELDRLDKASESVNKTIGAYCAAPTTTKRGLDVVDLGLKHWRLMRYSNKETLRINLSDERAKNLSNVLKLLEVIQKNEKDESHKNSIAYRIAFIQENIGMLQEALQTYSDLIAAQAMDTGVDLTFIIMKAATILKHVGNHGRALEYFEFLLDEPPEAEGYGRTHILAFLAMTYEHHPKRQEFATTLKKTYEDLLASYTEDLSKGNKPQTNEKMLNKIFQEKSVSQSSEIWEMISLQAIDRCEHLVAFELMNQAVEKAPTKHKSLHLLAEISYQLNYVERAAHYAERAFDIQPQNVELRGFLLMVAPEKWQDKLRNVATTKVMRKGADASSESGPGKKVQKAGDGDDDGGEEEGFFSKISAAINTGGVSPEQAEKKAKMQATREKKRKEKQARKEKKLAMQKMEEDKVQVKRTPGKPRDPTKDGPARPLKPVITQETLRLLEIAREGKNNIHYYDRTMMNWAHARVDIERGERQMKAQAKSGDRPAGEEEEGEDEGSEEEG